jgi:hypothetical protein
VRPADVRSSQVKAWTAQLKAADYADSTVYATNRGFAQIMGDAVHEGIILRSPCSRKTSPGGECSGPTWQPGSRSGRCMTRWTSTASILLGAFAGLRTAETCALRVSDVDFMRGIVAPAIQWPAEPLRSECSKTPVPIPQELALELAAEVRRYVGETVVSDELGQACSPWELQRAVRDARQKVKGCVWASGITTCGTASRRCSSPQGST